MKKILYILLALPTLAICEFEAEQEDQPTEETRLEDQKKDFQEERIEPMHRLEPEMHTITESEEPAPSKQVTAKAPLKFDFDQFQREDAMRAQKRAQEDQRRTKDWETEDASAAEFRNEQKFFKRLVKKATSDAASDQETQQKRNDTITKINRQRVMEEFTIKAQRFEAFKEKHSEFSQKAPWNSLLDLGDMNKFINMKPEERSQLLENIETLMADPAVKINDSDVAAIQDLVHLNHFNETGSLYVSPDLSHAIETDFASKTPQEQEAIKQKLLETLKSTMKTSFEKLKTFNKQMEDVQEKIKLLNNLETLQEIGYAATAVLGTAAIVAMLHHAPLAIGSVKLTMEQLGIGAKVGFVVGHKTGDARMDLELEIQSHFMESFQELMPETVKLLEAVTYKNKATSLTDRIKKSITSTKAYQAAQDLGSRIANTSGYKSAHDAVSGLKSNLSDTAQQVKSSKAYQTVSEGVSSIGSKLSKAAKSVSDGISKVAQKAKETAPYKAARDAVSSIGKKISETDVYKKHQASKAAKRAKTTARFDLATPTEGLAKPEEPAEQQTQDEEQSLQKQREIEDQEREKRWADEDKAVAGARNREGIFTRLTKILTTADSGANAEVEGTRNKAIQKINADRIAQDFQIKAKQFEDFKTKHEEFSKQHPWNTLLDLGDMPKFVNMDHATRTAFLEKINNIIQDPNMADAAFDINAVQDLINITRPYARTATIPSSDILQSLTSDFENKTESEKATIKAQLLSIMKDTIQTSYDTLSSFNDEMEAVKSDIDILNKLQSFENVAYAATMILGTVGGVCLLAHKTITVATVKFTVENLALGAKGSMLSGHLSGDLEEILSKRIQTRFKNAFQGLLPETTKLIETTTYEAQQKSLTERALDTKVGKALAKGASVVGGKISEASDKLAQTKVGKGLKEASQSAAKSARSGLQSAAKAVSSAAETVGKAVENSPIAKTSLYKSYKEQNAKSIDATYQNYNLAPQPAQA